MVDHCILTKYSLDTRLFKASSNVKTKPTSSGSQMALTWKPKRCLRPIRSKPHVRREGLLKEELVSYVCFLSRSHQAGIQRAHLPAERIQLQSD